MKRSTGAELIRSFPAPDGGTERDRSWLNMPHGFRGAWPVPLLLANVSISLKNENHGQLSDANSELISGRVTSALRR